MSDMEAWPPPDDPSAFESLCLDLWKEIWGNAGAQKNGRSGQGQHGVDVFGKDIDGRHVGVQCKQKSGLLRSKLTASELETEVKKAQGFKPSLSHFIVATTGPRDAAVQELARTLEKESPFAIAVWSWQEIWLEIYRRPGLLERIGPVYWPKLFALQGKQNVATSRLTHVAVELFGREKELADLDAAWADDKIHVVTLVAWGGVGKTSLVAKWAAKLDLGGADFFDWSFYSQGTREQGSISGEQFLTAALKFFGGEEGAQLANSPSSGREKGERLAQFIARRKALLILDGLEPLQYAPGSPMAGRLKDQGIEALLKGLARNNPGLCVVTTREGITEHLNAFLCTTVREWDLERLGAAAGIALLEKLGVWGSKDNLEKLVEDVKGHALTINLLGTFLAKAHHGDVRRRDRINLKKADDRAGRHAFRTIEAYENWLGEEMGERAQQLALLRLLGLFDCPADGGCIDALRQEPAIPGLTDSLVGLNEEDWNLTVSALEECRLLASSPAKDREGQILDAHPLVREYFALQLRETHPEAWRAAHGRLFEHLRDTTPNQPDTLQGLQPLYQAVAHGCHAGRYENALTDIYLKRISRGAEAFAVSKLGAFGADLGAVACFFDPPWRRVAPALSEGDQAWLLAQAASRLRALGRLTEALEPMRARMELDASKEDWKKAAIGVSDRSELKLTLGDVRSAVLDAEQSVTFADRSGADFLRVENRAAYANALHQAGHRAQALVHFCEAERLRGEMSHQNPWLYSLRGFWYCDLLLAEAERAAGCKGGANGEVRPERLREVEERANFAKGIATINQWLLAIALDDLTLGRAILYRAILAGSDLAPARAKIEAAMDGLHRAGDAECIVPGLLTRAWLFSREGNPAAARADLDEAQEIAERGPMPLYLADIALYRSRLFSDREALAEARRLIEKHGYGRRLEELADAEKELASRGAG